MVLLKFIIDTDNMSDLDHILASLEQLADKGIDITPAVYARFFARCPQAEALFGTAEARAVQGKMVNELVQTVLDRLEQKPYSGTVVETMVSDHDSWGVTLPMYDAFLAAFADTLQAALGDAADAAAMVLWRRELAQLRADVMKHLPVAAPAVR